MSHQAALNTFVVATSTRQLFRTAPTLRRLVNTPLYIQTHQAQPRLFSTTTSNRFARTSRKMGVHDLADKPSFQKSVIDGSKGQLVVLDCFATWCGPCKAISPFLVKLSNEDKFNNVGFYKIDVDQVPDVAQELGIRAMPTFLLFKDGEKVDELVGANPGKLQALVEQYA